MLISRSLINLPSVTIPPQAAEILEAIRGQGFIAGGYARDVLVGSSDASDIDIFCHEQSIEAVSIDVNEFEWQGEIIDELRGFGYEITRELPNAIEFKYELPVTGYVPVQLIKPFRNNWMKTFGSIEDVLGQFDFPVAKVALAFVHDEVRVLWDSEFAADERNKVLHIRHINCPVAVAMRVNKYTSKGYRAGPKEIIKLFKEWDARPDEYKKRLIELAEKETLDAKEWWEIEQLLRID